jgi:hypothetical protein
MSTDFQHDLFVKLVRFVPNWNAQKRMSPKGFTLGTFGNRFQHVATC